MAGEIIAWTEPRHEGDIFLDCEVGIVCDNDMIVYTVKFECGAEFSFNPLRLTVKLAVVPIACDIYGFFPLAFIKGPVGDESIFCDVGDTKVGNNEECTQCKNKGNFGHCNFSYAKAKFWIWILGNL